jgi:hypothetical protein
MRTPTDRWDPDERETIEELRDELETLQARHQHDSQIDLLRAARHDALPSDVQSGVEERLSNDPWARALVDGLDDAEPSLNSDDQDRLLARIRREATRGESADAKRWRSLRPLLTSAAVVAAAVAAWVALRSPSPAPPVVPTPSDRAVAGAQKPPVFQLPLDKPEVTISLAALTWRGGGADNQLLADLKAPLDAFRQGEYARADGEFAALESRYPGAVEVWFYGGVARLFLNDPERAMLALARADDLADGTFAPRVSWYRAIAEQRAGRVAEARERLDALCRGRSAYAAAACRAVQQLDSSPRTPDGR